jgi:hypothetical protein
MCRMLSAPCSVFYGSAWCGEGGWDVSWQNSVLVWPTCDALPMLPYLFEDATQWELAVAMDIDISALAKLLELLEKADYIRRKLDPTDRRLKRIFLTDGGRAVWETYKQTTSKLETNLTAGLDRGVRSHTGRNRRYYPERRTPAMRRIGAAADSKGYQRCTSTLRNYPALGAGVVM